MGGPTTLTLGAQDPCSPKAQTRPGHGNLYMCFLFPPMGAPSKRRRGAKGPRSAPGVCGHHNSNAAIGRTSTLCPASLTSHSTSFFFSSHTTQRGTELGPARHHTTAAARCRPQPGSRAPGSRLQQQRRWRMLLAGSACRCSSRLAGWHCSQGLRRLHMHAGHRGMQAGPKGDEQLPCRQVAAGHRGSQNQREQEGPGVLQVCTSREVAAGLRTLAPGILPSGPGHQAGNLVRGRQALRGELPETWGRA
jgi:hypothetical protein